MGKKKHAHVSGTAGEYWLVLDREALDAFGVSRLQVDGCGSRSLPTTFRKFRPVQALASAINQYMAPKAEVTSKELLEAAVKRDAHLAHFLAAYLQQNPLTVEQQTLVDYARECYHRDGELEFDNLCIPSGVDNPDGDYVLCWKWVEKP